MAKPRPLRLGCVYHIYNRSTNGETLFHNDPDYWHFMHRYIHDIEPVAETYAYCLMKNHFHLAIRTRSEEEQATWHAASRKAEGPHPIAFHVLDPSHQFSVLFGAYAKWFNARHSRSGSLFEHPFDRKPVTSEAYYGRLITYIHHNPQHHGFVDDFRDWAWSSYGALVSSKPTRVPRDIVLGWFDGREGFVYAHDGGDDGLAYELRLE